MKKPKQAIYLVDKAIKVVPDQESEIKSKLKSCFKQMELIQKKKNEKKEASLTPAEKWRFDIETSQMISPWKGNAEEALKKIEDMIQQEESKLKENEKKNEEPKTIFG